MRQVSEAQEVARLQNWMKDEATWNRHFCEDRMNMYSVFLLDGDFEKYQPYCYGTIPTDEVEEEIEIDGVFYKVYKNRELTIEEFEEAKKEAYAITIPSNLDPLEYKRYNTRKQWIQNRFDLWATEDWQAQSNHVDMIYHLITETEKEMPWNLK